MCGISYMVFTDASTEAEDPLVNLVDNILAEDLFVTFALRCFYFLMIMGTLGYFFFDFPAFD